MLTVPDGSAESFSQVDWVACNLEYDPSQWSAVRNKAAAQNTIVIPWIRLANDHEDWEDVKRHLKLLVNTARLWKSPIILPNYEKEAERFLPISVAAFLDSLDWEGDTGWSMQGWLPNDVDFSPINDDPVLLQIFPADMRFPPEQIEEIIADCVYNSRVAHKFTYVGVTYQTYGNATYDWWPLEGTHSVYPGNLIPSSDWIKWFP